MANALYPGTFDPFTFGHLDVVQVATAMFHEVVIAVMINPTKTPRFTTETRVSMIEETLRQYKLDNVRVLASEGLTIDVARETGTEFIVRGLRLTTDYEQELFLLFNNQVLAPEVTTVLIPPKQEHIHISSTSVRTLFDHGNFAALSMYVPRLVEFAITP